MTAVLIPAYEPEMILVDYVRRLSEKGFAVVVADDGSGPDYAEVFSAAAEYAKVLTFEVNRGKGEMLKALYAEVLDNMPECGSVVTADSDGQHAVEDVLRVSEALDGGARFVLGTRDLKHCAPIRSRIGNGVSRFVFALSSSFWIYDNQTGLRGFSRDQLPWMMRIRGSRYDYELSVLWHAALQGIEICQLPIQTIYFDNNAKTHFRTVKDTFLLYRNLGRCNWVGVVCRALAVVCLAAADIFRLGIPWYISVPAVWVFTNALNLLIKKLIIFRGHPLKGALRSILSSFVALGMAMLMSALLAPGLGFPVSVCWILGKLAALPLRYFFCRILSKMAFSAERSLESSVPK